jgi:hypothetical protein
MLRKNNHNEEIGSDGDYTLVPYDSVDPFEIIAAPHSDNDDPLVEVMQLRGDDSNDPSANLILIHSDSERADEEENHAALLIQRSWASHRVRRNSEEYDKQVTALKNGIVQEIRRTAQLATDKFEKKGNISLIHQSLDDDVNTLAEVIASAERTCRELERSIWKTKIIPRLSLWKSCQTQLHAKQVALKGLEEAPLDQVRPDDYSLQEKLDKAVAFSEDSDTREQSTSIRFHIDEPHVRFHR